MSNTKNYDKKMLNEYLNKFSKEQLMEYFDIIAEYSFQDELFMEVYELADLLKELNRQVRCVDLSFPSVMDDESKEFFAKNPLYFFDYLNKEDIADIKKMIVDNQENMKTMMESNISDMKLLFNTNKEHQKDNLEREISHLKDLIAMTNSEVREDIKRLESRQNESNKVKERVAILTASVKSLHKRLDVDLPALLNTED